MKTTILNDLSSASDEQLVANYKNIVQEKKQWSDNIAHHESLIATNEKRVVLMEKMSAISDEKCRSLNPSFEFQKDEEWIRLHSELLKINSAAERKTVSDEITRLRKAVDSAKQEIARFDDALPKIVEELSRRGVSYE